jgi:hypothetical protein
MASIVLAIERDAPAVGESFVIGGCRALVPALELVEVGTRPAWRFAAFQSSVLE